MIYPTTRTQSKYFLIHQSTTVISINIIEGQNEKNKLIMEKTILVNFMKMTICTSFLHVKRDCLCPRRAGYIFYDLTLRHFFL